MILELAFILISKSGHDLKQFKTTPNSAQIGGLKSRKTPSKKHSFIYPSRFSGPIPKKFGLTKKKKEWIEKKHKKKHKFETLPKKEKLEKFNG